MRFVAGARIRSRHPVLLSASPVILLQDCSVVDTKESDCRHDVALHSNFGAFARHTAIAGEDPQPSGSIINLIDTLSQGTNRLSDRTDNGHFFVHKMAGVGVNVSDFDAFARRQYKSEGQYRK